MAKYRLISNRIRCKFCGDVIQSRSRHDMQMCKCGACLTDGGTDYIRRGYKTENPSDCFEDLSTYQDVETGKLLTAKEVDMNEVPSEPVVKGDIQGMKAPDAPQIDDAPEISEDFIPEVKPKESEAPAAEEKEDIQVSPNTRPEKAKKNR